MKSALEYSIYFFSISSRFIEGFIVLRFESIGLIRISDEVVFVFTYSEASAVPNECAIIIGFSILFSLIIDSRTLIRFDVLSESLDSPWPGRSNDKMV